MTHIHHAFQGLLRQLEQEHGPRQELRPLERCVFAVFLDDGAEFRLRWPRGVTTPVWEVTRLH